MIYETEYEQRCMPVFRIGHFPSESDSETMLKVLKWGVVPLNLKGHGMTPHSLCWARTNSPQFIHRFNSKWQPALFSIMRPLLYRLPAQARAPLIKPLPG